MSLAPVTFTYLNHRGEIAVRRVIPDSIEFIAKVGFNYQPGWFLSGKDLDKNLRRSFALSRIVYDPDVNRHGLLSLPLSVSL